MKLGSLHAKVRTLDCKNAMRSDQVRHRCASGSRANLWFVKALRFSPRPTNDSSASPLLIASDERPPLPSVSSHHSPCH
jgi:hypothetical protein